MADVNVEPVGVCGACGEPAMLRMREGCRSVACGCGVTVPEGFFAAAGYGDAARTSRLERIAAARVSGERILP